MGGKRPGYLFNCARALLFILACLAIAPAASYGATLSHIGTVTVPSTIFSGTTAQANAVILGPQSIQIDPSNSYTSSQFAFKLDAANGAFITSSQPTVSGATCTSITVLQSIYFDHCTLAASSTSITVSGLTYNNASGLAAGTSVNVSGSIYNANNANQVFEQITAASVITPPPIISIPATVAAFRSATTTITVTRTGSTTNTATVNYATSNGTATSGTDYTATSGTLTFAADSATATISIATLNNAAQTVPVTFTVTLSSASTGYTLGTAAATVTISVSASNVLTTATNGSGTGTVTASPLSSTSSYNSGTVVTLTAAPATGSIFGGWSGGGCSGTALTCQVTMSSSQTVTATFTLAGPFTLTTRMDGKGTGTMVTVPSASTYAAGSVVTVVAIPSAGSAFGAWSGGGCTGTVIVCQVTMSSNQTVTATFNTASTSDGTLRQPAVFSSAAADSLSFLRFYNADTAAGTVTVTLADYASGQTLGQWTSPSIAAGTAPQYAISTIESALAKGTTPPKFYSVTMQAQFAGTFQHVLWKPSDGTLTNLSNCNSGIDAIPARAANVHSSALGSAGYPSSIVVFNTGTSATTAALAVYDAANATKLGTYTTASIPANGEVVLTVSAIETALGLTASSSTPHYVITAPNAFTGFVQHLLTNSRAGVITDMSAVCPFVAANSSSGSGNPSGN